MGLEAMIEPRPAGPEGNHTCRTKASLAEGNYRTQGLKEPQNQDLSGLIAIPVDLAPEVVPVYSTLLIFFVLWSLQNEKQNVNIGNIGCTTHLDYIDW